MTERYPIIAESNGHKWTTFGNLTCCRDCGIVRRADDNNKQCRGKVAMRPLTPPEQRATHRARRKRQD